MCVHGPKFLDSGEAAKRLNALFVVGVLACRRAVVNDPGVLQWPGLG